MSKTVGITVSCSVIKFCIGLGKLLVDMLKLIRNSETKNPCSVSIVYKWHERFRNGRKSTEDDLRDGRSCVVKMTIKDKVKKILFTPISKSLIKLDVLKQQSSNFTEMTFEFSRHFYSVANSAGRVDCNCEL